MRRSVVRRPGRASSAFQLYARNDPKQVPRRNVHIISRPDASKGAGYDFIRVPRLLSAFFCLLPQRARFPPREARRGRAKREGRGRGFFLFRLKPGRHGTLLSLLLRSLSLSFPPFSSTSWLYFVLPPFFSGPLSPRRPPRRHREPRANSRGRITRNPMTLWPVNGSTPSFYWSALRPTNGPVDPDPP